MVEELSRNCLKVDNIVIKTTRHTPGMAEMGHVGFGNKLHMFTYQNEIEMLLRLRPFDRVPNLIESSPTALTISMTYCGEQINKSNLPKDWVDQMTYILESLREYDVSHNDIKPSDILVYNNKLMLVDFGWATIRREEIPEDWPVSIGSEFRYGVKDFNDSYSFMRSVQHIINKELNEV
tara:strand:+ start:3191 stop:3727 length:537 start_codon:yes stop_codon:yes gene_type:complete